MKKEIRILMLEDEIADAELVKHALRKGGLAFALDRVETREEFREELAKEMPELILSDYSLPSFDGFAALAMAKEQYRDVPFIFVTGTLGEEVAIETLKKGATDYVLKTKLSRLVPAVHRALQEARERAEHRRAEEQLRESHEQLRSLTTYLQHVREEERTRIAREVHDELGQALTGLRMDLAWLVNRLPRNLKTLHEKVQDMASHIDATIQTVRRISTELRPGVLDDLGLAAAIEWQAHEFQTRTGIPCPVDITVMESVFTEEINTTVFRIFQETLTNVVRHANANAVQVRLADEDDHLILVVKDNGHGIPESAVASPRSIGLVGMRERAALLGGTLLIQGIHGEGTTVTVKIPLRRPAPNHTGNHENSAGGRSRSRAARVEANSCG